jgi:hypothetical protein
MKRKFASNNKGSLPVVLMVFIVLFILAAALVNVSIAETKNATWQNNRVQAHYIARSGVLTGIEALKDRLQAVNHLDTIADIADDMNSLFNQPSYEIAGAGSYTINFSVTTLNEIMITSVGTTALAEPNTTSTVTFSKRISKGVPFSNANDQWLHTNGFSLAPGILPDSNPDPYEASFLGSAAEIQAVKSSMKNPSVGSPANVSKFRASVISVGEIDGDSLELIPNSYGEFDSEVIFFNGDILVNSTKAEMTFRVSEAVLLQKDNVAYNDAYPNPANDKPGGQWELDILEYTTDGAIDANGVGFENLDRYLAFISPESSNSSYHVSTSFEANQKYGVVRLQQIIPKTGSIFGRVAGVNDGKGYFYFPDGVEIGIASERARLIAIDDDDPITEILDGFFEWKYGVGQEMWNNK